MDEAKSSRTTMAFSGEVLWRQENEQTDHRALFLIPSGALPSDENDYLVCESANPG
jgi:hypothetical protein